MNRNYIALIALVVFATAGIAAGQSLAGISGTVKDPNGDVIRGARVSAIADNGVIAKFATTDQEGVFSIRSLSPGKYVLRVSASGFADAESEVQISAENVQQIDITLAIGQSRTTVTAEVGTEVDIQKVAQPVTVISADEIMNRATSVLALAGEEEAGLNVQRTSPTIGAIIIRGLTGKNVVNFVDGVRYTNGAQRGGINTFFNLNEPTSLQSIEVVRGPNGAQYGSDSLAGTVNLVTKNAPLGLSKPEFHGEFNPTFRSADRSFGSNLLLSYGTQKFGGYVNLAARRVGTLRTAGGIDSHSAITRFLGLSSTVLYERSLDTAFTQYGGAARLNYAIGGGQQLAFFYQRSQQDGGKRFDQLIGGDGNLIADLRNLMLDFAYLRYVNQSFLGFDTASFTGSFNSQREERVNQGGQGNPFGDITHQYERTTVLGFSFFLEKLLPARNTFIIGGDVYGERFKSPAFTVDPVTNTSIMSRPRIPDNARFDSGGIYVQDAWEAIPDRLRLTGALRYSGMKYRVSASDSPIVNNQRLWSDDRLSTADLSGRIGAVITAAKGLRFALNYGRGFRYPSMTDLGTLGLTGDGFEVDHITAGAFGGTIGTTAGADAISTGLPVEKQRSEISHNIDFSLRYENKRFDTELTVFRLDIVDAITKQALIMPPGAVGRFLGDQQITSQLPNGVVYVAASSTPVLVRANFTSSRSYGIEYEAEARLTKRLTFRGNYTYVHAEDKETGLPPNIEGGTPPPTGFLSIRYSWPRLWVEGYSTLADRQDRLSSLDLSDRRTGASRSRTQIENFFRRGACVRGLTQNPAGTCNANVNTYTLLATGENIAQVLTRVLGPGFPSSPLFTHLPGYATANIRGGVTINDRTRFYLAFENILDQFYRNPSWGIDGPGRSITAQLRYSF